MRVIFVLATALVLACGAAGSARAQQATRSAFTDPAGHRGIRASIAVPAAPAEVWRGLTTGDAWRRMGVGFAAVDFRLGGVVETNYQQTGKSGDPGNIKNQIVAFDPGRMLAIRNIQAPPGFPRAGDYGRTATVIDLAEAGHGQTRVTVTGVGFAPGPGFDVLLGFFGEGNATSLEALARSYAAGRAP